MSALFFHSRHGVRALALALLSALYSGCATPLDEDGDQLAAEQGDCDDWDASVRPGFPDGCDGQDSDCDGRIDEDVELIWYQDLDGDGYGTEAATQLSCNTPSGYARQNGDCDDTNPMRFPGAAEICDGLDNTCDGRVDEDQDQDGFAPCAKLLQDADCDESNATVYPRALESWEDALDQDCDGIASPDAYVSADGSVMEGLPHFTDPAEALRTLPEGSVVLVGPGTYRTQLEFRDKAMVLISELGPEDTILEAAGLGSTVVFMDSTRETSFLKGFTITGGTGSDPEYCGGGLSPRGELNGGGICLRNASPRLSQLIVRDNSAGDGGGIQMSASAPLLEDIRIEDNRANDDGGGLYLYASAPTLKRVRVERNQAQGFAGGIGFYNSSPKSVQGLEVFYNRARSGAGLYIAYASSPVLSYGWVAYNQSEEDGGGFHICLDSTPVLTHFRFDENTVQGESGRGGGGLVDAASLQLRNSMVRGNVSAYEGGGLAFDLGATPVLENVVIARNSARLGGGLFSAASQPVLKQLVVAENSASQAGGGIGLSFSTLQLQQSIVAYNRVGSVANNLFSEEGASGVSLGQTLWWSDNGEAAISGLNSSGVLVAEPYFQALAGGDPSGGDYRLAWPSAAIDGGSSAEALLDPDGSAADLGAFGGPAAAVWDLDADGLSPSWNPYNSSSGEFDCDDEQALGSTPEPCD
ncbi:MAG: MopE-related protein [Myxococcota bacterium]